jgi:hypothetical protein
MAARDSREMQTRETTSRKKLWQPADLLPAPTPQEGYEFRWIRKSMMGQSDPTNTSRSFREGWEPCRLDDHPELALSVDVDAKSSGIVEVGGLILCKMPVEMVLARNSYYQNNAAEQLESVDNNLMRENDSRMPMFKEAKSTVSFGRGS